MILISIILKIIIIKFNNLLWIMINYLSNPQFILEKEMKCKILNGLAIPSIHSCEIRPNHLSDRSSGLVVQPVSQ